MKWDFEIDARGLLCPLPVLRLRKRLTEAEPGKIARLEATDPASVIDVPHFCAESGHDLLGQTNENGAHIFYIRRV